MTRSFTTHRIFPLLFLATCIWVNSGNAFIPTRYSIIGQQHYDRKLFVKLSAAADEINDNNGQLPKRRKRTTAPKKKKSILEQKLAEHFERLTSDEARSRAPSSDHDGEIYLVREKFMDADFYWQDKVLRERFTVTLRKGCLYRPTVVEDLYTEVENALDDEVPCGIMVKGPQGIGKSHTLINLVRKLLYGSNGKYLVTFIPDCSYFEDEYNLLDAICASFGSTPEDLGNPAVSTRKDFQQLIDEITSILADMDKQWIFIFDQINRIFARSQFEKVKDLGTISFPFSLIHKAMKSGRITSIISASANNEIAYKDRHAGFEEYYHPLSMNWNELQMLYPLLKDKNEDSIMQVTGGVPLQVSNLINVNFEVAKYEKIESQLVVLSLKALEDNFKNKGLQERFKDIKKSAIACVLGIAGDMTHFDRRYSVPRQGETEYYDPVYPLILSVYRNHFWDDIMAFVTENEKTLLSTCRYSQTTNDVRGRLFENIVINRCIIGGDLTLLSKEHDASGGALTEAEFPGLSPCQPVELFPGNELPSFQSMARSGMYVPQNPNFPAIDIIWKMNSITWFVQVHVGKKTTDALPKLKEMCKEAGWQDKIYFLYLSPEDKVTELLPQSFLESSVGEPDIVVKALSIKSFSCLSDIQWPEGCSLN